MRQVYEALDMLAKVLAPYEKGSAKYIRNCRSRTAQEIADDLGLWGGPGSIMDQALAEKDRKIQRPFEVAAIDLVSALEREGATNQRMRKWADTFTQWQSEGT